MAKREADELIDALVDELRPVRGMWMGDGLAWLGGGLALTLAAVALWFGFRADLTSLSVSPLYLITHGLLLLLGLAAASAVIAMASPQVGARHDGPKWAMAMVGLLPLAALGTTLANGVAAQPLYSPFPDIHCLARGTGFGALVAAVLLAWLRRGAPVSLARAGLYLGTAAGALGSFAYGLSCPVESMNHLGIWHVLPVPLCAIVARFGVPPLVRW